MKVNAMTTKKKTIKKPVKKNLNKTVAPVAVPPLDKKHAIEFGNSLFSIKDGVIQCLTLCDGTLQNGKVGGRTTHCAIGEVYHVFVNPLLSKVLHTANGTGKAIKAVVEVAKLKDPSVEGQARMADLLNEMVDTNDEHNHDNPHISYMLRAEAVQRAWREDVIPLLK